MRIATWNVNSIGARLPRLLDWLTTRQPDAVALQETKAADSAFPYAEVADLGYEALHVGDGRWNGVAIVARGGLTPLSSALPGLTEARYANALCHPVGGGRPLQVISVYVPNGRAIDDAQYPYKLDWLAALRQTLDDADPEAIVGGETASNLDARESAARDLRVIVPSVLVVITLVLALLLRSLVAPLLLVATVVLSVGATVGVAALLTLLIVGGAVQAVLLWPGPPELKLLIEMGGIEPSIAMYSSLAFG